METKRICDKLEEAALILKDGGLVAVPTETVYGLAGNGLNEASVLKIYSVKGRPEIKPLSLMVSGTEAMEQYCEEVPVQAYALAGAFWPGPLTIVLKAKGIIPAVVLAGGRTVGLRCPDHPMTQELLKQCGIPLAAPSANPSGEPSPKNAEDVLKYFDGIIDAVIDGGPCGIGKESTLIDMSCTPYRILRVGALSAEKIADALVDSMQIIGITGGSGCGKTSALLELEHMGALILDCDALYHELLETDRELLEELDRAFPETVFSGRLDRKALATVVFSSPEELKRLNRITHRYVSKAVNDRLRAHAMAGGRLAAVDAIELIASGLAEQCDCIVGVLSEHSLRVERIMARDGIDRQAAENRISAQKSDAYFKDNCDYILYNNADYRSFQAKCRELFREVLKNE